EQNGINDGRITKDQYMSMIQSMMSRFGGGMGGMPGGGMPGASPTGGSPSPMTPPGGERGDRGDRGDPGQRGDRGGGWGGGGGGWGGPPNPDMIAEARFRALDQNGDGLLNYDELQADETLRAEREKFDENNDGFIDAKEFRNYIQARIQQWQAQA